MSTRQCIFILINCRLLTRPSRCVSPKIRSASFINNVVVLYPVVSEIFSEIKYGFFKKRSVFLHVFKYLL